MNNMHELLTVQQFDRTLAVAAVILALSGAGLGAACGCRRQADRRGSATTALGWACLAGAPGLLLYGLWRLFSFLVRYNPETGQAGLHRLPTLGLCLLLFVAVGVAYGSVVGACWQKSSRSRQRASDS